MGLVLTRAAIAVLALTIAIGEAFVFLVAIGIVQ
jgi:hypothetical protein